MSARPVSGMGVMSPPPSAAMGQRGGMVGGGPSMSSTSSTQHQYQHHQGHMRAAMPHSAPSPRPPPPPASNAPPGSLLPGTLVRVGPYTVTVKRYLSQGGFATVYLCVTDKPVAIPVVDITGKPAGSISETTHVLKRIVVPDKEALAEVRKEVEVHKLLRHDASVVHFLEASALSLPPPQQGYEVYILMEYCAGGGLLDLLNSRLRNRLAEAEVLTIFADICKGVAAMHHLDPPVLHRDLKIENILLANSNDPKKKTIYKLCDFGSAKPILSRRAPRSTEELKRLEMELNKTTTLPYRPPEMVDVYQRKVIDEKADIWALGVLLYKLCYYTTPFEENGGGPLAILNVKYRFPSNPPYSDRVKGLIASILVDPSTRRPTIDDLLITVHKLLGIPPPASATHYAQLAKEGKQASALPQLTSSGGPGAMSGIASPSTASHRRAVDDAVLVTIAKENSRERAGAGQGRPVSIRGDLRPSGSISSSSRQSPSPVLPARSRDDSTDLISFQPSQRGDKTPSAAESERLMKLEGVTPMRRGRPAGSNNTPTKPGVPGDGIGKLNLDSFGLKSDTPGPSQRPPSANQQKAVPISIDTSASNATSPPSSSARVGNLLDGFGDSFAPEVQPPAAGTTAQGALTTPLSTSEAERKVAEFVRRGEEASDSPMVLSPALPGLNGVSSPIASLSPLPPLDSAKDDERRLPSLMQDLDPQERKVSLAQSEGTAAAGRFPSLEELDRRYPSPPKIVAPKPDASTSTSASKRESMAALAGKFGGLSASVERGGERPTPALPPRKPWQSRFDDAEEDKVAGRGHRFEAKEDASPSYRSPARFSGTSPGPAAVEKEQVVQTANGAQAATEKKQQDDSSDEEDEGPESIEGGVAAARKRWGGGQWAQDVQQATSSTNDVETAAVSDRPGKVKQPDWVRRSEEQPQRKPSASSTSKDEKPRPLLPSSSKPLIDFDAGKSRDEDVSAVNSPAIKEEMPVSVKSATTTTAQSRAPAWEWDADEADAEEMRALARPRLDARLDSEAGGGLLGRLVDVNEETRSYGGGPTSAGAPNKASSNPLEDRSASMDVPTVPLKKIPEPSKQTSTDSTRSATSGLPSRQRLAMGKVYSDAATSPAIISPSPTPDSGASAEPIHSPPSLNRPSSPSKGESQPSSVLYEEPKKYAPGTAQSMASRWESMKAVGPAGAPKDEHRRSTSGQGAERTAIQPRRETTDSPVSTFSHRASLSSASSTNGAPQIIRPMPSKPPSSAKPRLPPPGPASSLKPWEREAAERAEADKSSHVRSSSYTRGTAAQEEEAEEAEREERTRSSSTLRRNGTSSANASGLDLPSIASTAGSSPNSTPGPGGDTQRYRSVASLIDKWQANAKSTRPETGWGEIGAGSGGGGSEKRAGGPNEVAAAAAARARMPGREV